MSEDRGPFLKRSRLVALSLMGVAAGGVALDSGTRRSESCDRVVISDSVPTCVLAGGDAAGCASALEEATTKVGPFGAAGVAVTLPRGGKATVRSITRGSDLAWRDAAGATVVDRSTCRQVRRTGSASSPFMGSRGFSGPRTTTSTSTSSRPSGVSRGGFGGTSRSMSSSSRGG